MSWARRSRLEPFKRLAATLKTHFDSVVRGMLDHRSNAFVEAMNGLMQQAMRAARGFSTCGQLHRHRLPAPGQTDSLADLTLPARRALECRRDHAPCVKSNSTRRNGIEP